MILILSASTLCGVTNTTREKEDWYFSTSAGIHNYFARNFNSYKEPGFGLSIDLLRYYYPVNSRLLIGGGIQLSFVIAEETVEDYTFLYSVYPSFSFQYYLNSIGDGFFFRGDVGFSRSTYEDEESSMMDVKYNDFGFGTMAAFGYAVVLPGRKTSLQFYLYYQCHLFNGIAFSFGGLSTGLLF